MRKYFIVCILVSLIIVGCGTPNIAPKIVLSKYLDAFYHNRNEEAYKYLSEKDKAVINLQEYLVKQSAENDSFTLSLTEKISYEIQDIVVNGEIAKAKVNVTTPDVENMFSDMMGTAFLSVFSGKDNGDMSKMMAEKYKNKDVPLVTTSQSYELVKEPAGWKVFLNLEKEKKMKALLEEAKILQKEKKLYGALKKYEEVLELDSEEVTANMAKIEMEKEITVFESKQSYIDNVELYDFEAKYFDSMFEGRRPGVTFKIKNAGDKILNRVEVTVYFKDSSGNVIAEEDYHPVLVSDFSLGDNKPLKPNYIWQMESGKFYQAKSVPSEWQEGNAIAKVTDIEFE
ncbi:hypothetical protein ACFL2G_03870 [Candidatus Omnitrophota bacterium]